MQTEPYNSIKSCVRQTYRDEGVRGFFRGVLPPLVTVSIIKSISFSVYEETKHFCKSRFPYLNRDELSPVMTLSTFGGAVSGAFIATFSCPVCCFLLSIIIFVIYLISFVEALNSHMFIHCL